MPQRDAARASSATTTGRPTVPAAEPAGGAAFPAGAHDAGPSSVADRAPSRPSDDRAGGGVTDRADAADAPEDDQHARLAAGSSASLWWVCAGIAAVLVVTFAVDVTAGALVLAGLLAVSALARAVLRPAPAALSVRSRATDCAVLTVLAVGVGLLAQLTPTG